jgi:PEP-CTERM motif
MAPFSGNFVIAGTTVPEASSLWLLGTGLLGVFATNLKKLRR